MSVPTREMITSPAATRTSPVTQTVRAPNRDANLGREPGRRHHRCRQGKHGQRGDKRAVATDALEVLQGDEGEPEEGEELDADREAAGGQLAVGEQARVQEGVVLAALEEHEPRQRSEAGCHTAEGAGAQPAGVGSLDDAEDQGDEPDRGEQRASFVERRRVRLRGLGDEADGAGQGDQRRGRR